MPDFLAIEAGLIYGGGDPDYLYGLPEEKREQVMGYIQARKEKKLVGASISPLMASDLVHLISLVFDGKKKKGDFATAFLAEIGFSEQEETLSFFGGDDEP